MFFVRGCLERMFFVVLGEVSLWLVGGGCLGFVWGLNCSFFLEEYFFSFVLEGEMGVVLGELLSFLVV